MAKSPSTKSAGPAEAGGKSRRSRQKASGTKAIEKACQEFVLNGGDQSKAYRSAYPHSKKWLDKTVHEKASRLFADSKVRARVAELKAEAARIAEEKFKVDAEYVLRRLVEIDKMDLLDILKEDGSLKPISEWPPVWRSYVSGMDLSEIIKGSGDERQMVGFLKKIKWPDKVKNLELLGKHVTVNAFREQVGLSDPEGGPIKTTTVDPSKLSTTALKELLAARASADAHG